MGLIKTVHVTCAYLIGLGFLIRGVLAVTQSRLLDARVAKTLPHIIDSFLLISGITLMVTTSLWPTNNPWLWAKWLALLVYIGFGLLMLRWGHSNFHRWTGFVGGFLVYLYIVGAAHSKSIVSIFAVF
ncbi:MAG: SirB2 family protein [Pseudomonadota bacterium]